MVATGCTPRVTALEAPARAEVDQLVTLTAESNCADSFGWTETGPEGNRGYGATEDSAGFAGATQSSYTVTVTPRRGDRAARPSRP